MNNEKICPFVNGPCIGEKCKFSETKEHFERTGPREEHNFLCEDGIKECVNKWWKENREGDFRIVYTESVEYLRYEVFIDPGIIEKEIFCKFDGLMENNLLSFGG